MQRERFKQGLMRYVKESVIPVMDRDKQFLAGVMVGMVEKRFDAILDELNARPIVHAMGIVNDTGEIDTEMLMDVLGTSFSEHGPVSMDIPLIGRLTFDANDLNKLRNMM